MKSADTTTHAQVAAEQHLTFKLAAATFGIALTGVREIVEYTVLTPVPLMQSFIRGVISLRGRGVPVVDLATRFSGGVTATTSRSCIVVVEMVLVDGSGQDIGLLVDTVNDVVDIRADEIETGPTPDLDIRPEFVSGLARRGDGFIILLNMRQVFGKAFIPQ